MTEAASDEAINARAARLDLPAIAQRLQDIADRAERIRLPSARAPHVFHEDMSEWRASLRIIARQLAGK
jgi:hypothetical protein